MYHWLDATGAERAPTGHCVSTGGPSHVSFAADAKVPGGIACADLTGVVVSADGDVAWRWGSSSVAVGAIPFLVSSRNWSYLGRRGRRIRTRGVRRVCVASAALASGGGARVAFSR